MTLAIGLAKLAGALMVWALILWLIWTAMTLPLFGLIWETPLLWVGAVTIFGIIGGIVVGVRWLQRRVAS